MKVQDAPVVIHATKPWDTVIEITRRGRPLEGYKAAITLKSPRGTHKIKAKELGRGRYRIRVRTPYGGFYTYTIKVGDRDAAQGRLYAIPK
jgi:hypothetical protein